MLVFSLWKTLPLLTWIQQSFSAFSTNTILETMHGRQINNYHDLSDMTKTGTSRDVVSKCLGLVETWEGLDLVSD